MHEKIEKILKKIKAGRQFRRNDIRPEFRALDIDANNGNMIVEGHATTFDEEYELFTFDDWDGYRVSVYEVVDRNAFAETDMSDVIFLYDHAGRVMARTRNDTLQIVPDDTGLFIRANLSNSDLGPGLFADIKNGYVDRMSMQFTVAKDSQREERDTENKRIKLVRTIEKVGKLYDVSAVGIPANDGTDISARSAADGAIRVLEAERLRRLIALKSADALKLNIDISLERVN